MASWTAAGTCVRHPRRADGAVLHLLFDVRLPAGRRPDLGRPPTPGPAGFLLGATAGRTTLLGEGLQHQDGHSHVLASTVPVCRAYDPAFAYEMATIIQHGIERMYGPEPEDVFYYLTLYNENYVMPPMADGVAERASSRACTAGPKRPSGVDGQPATILFSGPAHGAARFAQDELAEHYGVGAELWSATSLQAAPRGGLEAERWNRLHPTEPARTPRVTELLADAPGRSSPSPTS